MTSRRRSAPWQRLQHRRCSSCRARILRPRAPRSRNWRFSMPTMFIFRTYVEAGGLLSYGADFAAMHRQAATHVAKILKGAKVGDIPIEQPNRFEFAVNLRTAKAIGIEFFFFKQKTAY